MIYANANESGLRRRCWLSSVTESRAIDFVPSFVVRRADGDRALAEETCCPRTAAAISSRGCRR